MLGFEVFIWYVKVNFCMCNIYKGWIRFSLFKVKSTFDINLGRFSRIAIQLVFGMKVWNRISRLGLVDFLKTN